MAAQGGKARRIEKAAGKACWRHKAAMLNAIAYNTSNMERQTAGEREQRKMVVWCL